MFKRFIEEYMQRMTEEKTLEALLKEARRNHRVQKLLVPYIAKDTCTFKHMLSLASKDPFAQKLVKHCSAIVHDLFAKQEGMRELMNQINQVTGFLSEPRPKVRMAEWESVGYTNVFNRYLLQDKMAKMDMDEEMAAKRDQLLKAFEEMSAASA